VVKVKRLRLILYKILLKIKEVRWLRLKKSGLKKIIILKLILR